MRLGSDPPYCPSSYKPPCEVLESSTPTPHEVPSEARSARRPCGEKLTAFSAQEFRALSSSRIADPAAEHSTRSCSGIEVKPGSLEAALSAEKQVGAGGARAPRV